MRGVPERLLGAGALAINYRCAAVAQLVERVLGKDEVMGSSPISSFEAHHWDRFLKAEQASRFTQARIDHTELTAGSDCRN